MFSLHTGEPATRDFAGKEVCLKLEKACPEHQLITHEKHNAERKSWNGGGFDQVSEGFSISLSLVIIFWMLLLRGFGLQHAFSSGF